MGEIETAEKEGRLLESFGAGTAAVISPVKAIYYKGKVRIYVCVYIYKTV
jgi:branched-chain amino acid aminotransferase